MAEGGTFAERLRIAMAARGVANRAALATLLDTRQTTVVPWFNADRLPDGTTLVRIAERLRVSLDWLLLGRGPMDPPDADAYAQGVADATAGVLQAVREVRHRAALPYPIESYPPLVPRSKPKGEEKGAD